MDELRQYLIRVLAAAIICAIIIRLSDKQQLSANMIRLVASVFLSVCVIGPILKLDISNITANLDASKTDATYITENASTEAINETVIIIKERTKSYIENKADTYGADINATITISDPSSLIPDGIRIEGNVSPYIKTVLTTVIREDLGIPEENQIWN